MNGDKLTKNALVVLKKRGYLKRTGQGYETPQKMFQRVALLIASVDKRYQKSSAQIKITTEKFYEMLFRLEYLSGSVLLNSFRKQKQFSACYVLPLNDSIGDIFDQLRNAALIARTGGGIGIPLSNLRPRGSMVESTGGISSGAVSFLRLFNYSAATIAEASTRRPAMMGVLAVNHPDIIEFIMSKDDPQSLYHFNISVGANDEFMSKVKKGKGTIHLFHPNDGQTERDIDVSEIWNLIATQAWKLGDPGLIFPDRMNRDNPTPKLGRYEATNPCFIGSTRVTTPYGMLSMEELEKIGQPMRVAADERSNLTADGIPAGLTGVEMMPASPARQTGKQVPVMTLTTKGGFSVTATPDHRFLTPSGYIAIKDLQPEDKVLIQSAEGIFNTEKLLPNRWLMENYSAVAIKNIGTQKVLVATRTKANSAIPQKWNKEVGEVLGWMVGDGWLTKSGNRAGVVFGYKAGESARIIGGRLKQWFGGCESRRDRVIQLTFSGSAYYFFYGLGVKPVKAEAKRVPEAIWSAPRVGVTGFLRGLFGADGTFQWDKKRQYSSVRLASNSKLLLQDVQLLLLNLGILGKIFLRRQAQWRLMPDSSGLPKKYWTQPQYELIIGAQHRNRFLSQVGFADPVKQNIGEEFLSQMTDGAYTKPFVDTVESIVPVGQADVYDLSQPATKSFIANGFVVHNCGEQPLLPYESCNLGNINLGKFVSYKQGKGVARVGDPRRPPAAKSRTSDGGDERQDPFVNWPRLEEVVRLGVHFQDNVIDLCDYPIPQLEKMAKTTRKIGLGVMGWADMLVKLGIRYDSRPALKLAEKIAKFIQTTARDESAELGRERGSFPAFDQSTWKKKGLKHLRNSAVNTVAPTGTISIIAGCSSGIEPIFALVYRRENVLDLGKTSLLEVNRYFKSQIAELLNCYLAKDKNDSQSTMKQSNNLTMKKILNEVSGSGSCQNIKGIPKHIKDVFRTSTEISFDWHIKMQAAWQKFTDAAVSKTINLPNNAAIEDVKNAYLLAYETGCKGITIYRDGCRDEQVLNIGSKSYFHPSSFSPQPSSSDVCPECRGVLAFADGCATCLECGYSKCNI